MAIFFLGGAVEAAAAAAGIAGAAAWCAMPAAAVAGRGVAAVAVAGMNGGGGGGGSAAPLVQLAAGRLGVGTGMAVKTRELPEDVGRGPSLALLVPMLLALLGRAVVLGGGAMSGGGTATAAAIATAVAGSCAAGWLPLPGSTAALAAGLLAAAAGPCSALGAWSGGSSSSGLRKALRLKADCLLLGPSMAGGTTSGWAAVTWSGTLLVAATAAVAVWAAAVGCGGSCATGGRGAAGGGETGPLLSCTSCDERALGCGCACSCACTCGCACWGCDAAAIQDDCQVEPGPTEP